MIDHGHDAGKQARVDRFRPVGLLLHGIPLDERVSWLRTLQDIETLPETSG